MARVKIRKRHHIFAFVSLCVAVALTFSISFAKYATRHEYTLKLAMAEHFTFSAGNQHTFETPYDGYYAFRLWGGDGGHSRYSWRNGEESYPYGGKGGLVEAVSYFEEGTELVVIVGTKGGTTAGGFNGGGDGSSHYVPLFDNHYGGGGGGATDLRLSSATLEDRILVAGGGGGGSGGGPGYAPAYGGDGGAKNGNYAGANGQGAGYGQGGGLSAGGEGHQHGDVGYGGDGANSGGGGGGISIGGAIIGGMIAGDVGAIVGSRQGTAEIKSELVTHDSRCTILKTKTTSLRMSFEAYDVLSELIPEKEYNVVQELKKLSIVTKSSSTTISATEQIRELAKLKDDAILTEEEFIEKKRELLTKM